MCGGVHYGEVEGLVSVERWSCSRGASCVAEFPVKSQGTFKCFPCDGCSGQPLSSPSCGAHLHAHMRGLLSSPRSSISRMGTLCHLCDITPRCHW